ncbi:MAG: hypothetical protein ACT4PJ_15170 [Gemmatimonadaceae bacterium]
MSYQSILLGLVRHEIDFVVVGGVAAALHGSARVTNDLDVCYDSATENVARLAALLASWNPYPRGWEAGLPFTMDERTLRTTPMLTLTTSQGDLDLLTEVSGVGDYAAVLRSSVPMSGSSFSFRVLDLEPLIRSKRATGREKDLAQLPELEALRELRKRRR